jgi:hypothetical protein
MKSLDLEWVVNNWRIANDEARLAAAKEMRKRLRASMTALERMGRGLAPVRSAGNTLARVQELRSQGLSLPDAVAKVRQEDAHLPPWQVEEAPQLRQQLRSLLDEKGSIISVWAALYPAFKPAWTDLERRVADLHTRLRLDDAEGGEGS